MLPPPQLFGGVYLKVNKKHTQKTSHKEIKSGRKHVTMLIGFLFPIPKARRDGKQGSADVVGGNTPLRCYMPDIVDVIFSPWVFRVKRIKSNRPRGQWQRGVAKFRPGQWLEVGPMM